MNPSNFTYPLAPIGARPLANSMLSSSQGKISKEYSCEYTNHAQITSYIGTAAQT